MKHIFPFVNGMERLEEEGLAIRVDGIWAEFDSASPRLELVELLKEKGLYSEPQKVRIPAEIDCPVCAKKIENGLARNPKVEKASFSLTGKLLTVVGYLSEEEIRKEALAIDDEIVFLDGQGQSRLVIAASVDCPNCARRIEEGLKRHDRIRSASFELNSSKLVVDTSLSEDEVKKLVTSLDKDVVFPDHKRRRLLVLDADIDCPTCAHKIEQELMHVDGIFGASFDFRRKKLKVDTLLEEEKVKAEARRIDQDIVFQEKKKKEKADFLLIRVILSAVILVLAFLTGIKEIAVLAFLASGYDVVFKAVRNLFKGRIFDENFLMTIATLGALFISSYEEAAGVMIFYQIGEMFQKRALGRSRRNIEELLDLTEETVTLVTGDELRSTSVEDVQEKDVILVRPGEKISLDGEILEGASSLDEKAITGESLSRNVGVGDKVSSGSVNNEGVLKIKVTSRYEDSTASKIVRLVKESEEKKAGSELFITRFARYYTPLVCLVTLLTIAIPTLLLGQDPETWLYRGLMLLVISCPCALVLSVPLSYFASIGAFAKKGILVKNSETVERLSRTDVIAFDKTGTLSEGSFSIVRVEALECNEQELLDIASSIERMSNHPIARAIVEAHKGSLQVESFKEIPGSGVEAVIGQACYKVGRSLDYSGTGVEVVVEKDGRRLGSIILEDRIKDNASAVMSRLKDLGIRNLVMLSGDRRGNAEYLASKAGIKDVRAPLKPEEKLEEIERLLDSSKVLVYVGDGINDSPSLMRADVGISMGCMGSDAAIEASDAVITHDNLDAIPTAIRISRKTERIVKENIIFSIAIKLAIMVLGILGLANMWMSVFADTGVALIATLNAMRALKVDK